MNIRHYSDTKIFARVFTKLLQSKKINLFIQGK